MSEEKKYAVVTTISTFRMRYCIPVEDLGEESVAAAYAMDTVTLEEAEEFSQLHLGENIIDSVVMNEKEMLELFDRDNDYLKSWTTEQKLKFVNDWKVK